MRSEPLVLGFDTSAAHCAAALVSGPSLLARAVEPMAKGQAERLMPMLEALLAEAGRDWAALDGIAVCTGPGNFTGARIGVAAARGLALALGVPAVGVTRLEALSHGRPEPATYRLRVHGRAVAQRLADGVALGPIEAAEAAPGSPGEDPLPDPEAIARLGALRLAGGERTRPAPVYVRPPDAALPTEAPPLLLDP